MNTIELTSNSFSEWAENDPELSCAVAAAQDLPAMTDIINEFLTAIQDADWSARAIGQIIAKDPAVAACILKVANSAYYSFRRHISNIEEAVAVLGISTVKSLVLAASVKSMNRRFGLIEKLLLEDSIGCALSARAITRKTACYPDAEEAFLGGLLRHIGKIAMNNLDAEKYSLLVQDVYNGEGELDAVERSYFPYTHAAVGAALLDRWNLAPALVASTLYHNESPAEDKIGEQAAVLARIVNLAGLFCLRLGIGQRLPQEDLDIAACPQATALALTETMIEEILEEVRDAFEETRESFAGRS
jgi:HD-like signal output (HDOD) protein